MTNNSSVSEIEKIVNGLLEEMPGYFLVQVRIKPTNNVKVFLDGDEGISIETCIRINRKLYSILEESSMFPDGDFSLEVSSPGVGEPLLLHRQYIKNIGRWVRIDAIAGESLVEGELLESLEGELKSVENDAISVETSTGKGKKQQLKLNRILFKHIKSTSVQIKF